MTHRVLITAGGSGIGLAMAQAFAQNGASVWVTDVDSTSLDNLPDGIGGHCVDATDETAMSALFREIETEWNGIDVLCANAGIAGPTALIEDIEIADWQKCVSVNLRGRCWRRNMQHH